MFKRWLSLNPPTKIADRKRLADTLNEDLRAGYTPLAFGHLASGWTLQIGQVAYDWHREGSTLYRNGSALVAGFQSAECLPQRQNPGVWILQGVLQGKPFRCSLHSSSLDRRWPYFESINRVMAYWQICFILEAYRHPHRDSDTTLSLGAIQDEVHGLYFQGHSSRVGGLHLVGCELPERQRSMGIWLDLSQPLRLEEGSDVFLNHIRGAMAATPPEAVYAKEHFWHFLVQEANRFAEQNSTRWAVR